MEETKGEYDRQPHIAPTDVVSSLRYAYRVGIGQRRPDVYKGAIKFANDDMAEAKMGLAEAGEKKAAAEGDLEVTAKDLAGDIAQKKDLHHDCMTKA